MGQDERPKRIDYGSDVAVVEAVHEYNRRFAETANRAFDDAFRKALRARDSQGQFVDL
jgi:hypothetical protein